MLLIGTRVTVQYFATFSDALCDGAERTVQAWFIMDKRIGSLG
jgi:hypothetical protein